MITIEGKQIRDYRYGQKLSFTIVDPGPLPFISMVFGRQGEGGNMLMFRAQTRWSLDRYEYAGPPALYAVLVQALESFHGKRFRGIFSVKVFHGRSEASTKALTEANLYGSNSHGNFHDKLPRKRPSKIPRKQLLHK